MFNAERSRRLRGPLAGPFTCWLLWSASPQALAGPTLEDEAARPLDDAAVDGEPDAKGHEHPHRPLAETRRENPNPRAPTPEPPRDAETPTEPLAPDDAEAPPTEAPGRPSSQEDRTSSDRPSQDPPRATARPRPRRTQRHEPAPPPPVSGDPACEFRVPLHQHVVQKDEHLGTIAGRYGVRSKELLRLNPDLRDPNLIRPGDKIRVCPVLPPRERIELTHVVRAGDTASAIAKAHELTLPELQKLQNGKLDDPNALRIGQALRIVKDGEILAAFRPRPESHTKLVGGVPLPHNDHYLVKRSALAYGTPRTVALIRSTVETYRSRRGGPKVFIGDLSRRDGGALPPHVSHRNGRDVDIGYVLRGDDQPRSRFVLATRRNLDIARTWALISSFLNTDEVVYLFVDYEIQALLYEYARDHGTSDAELEELFQYPRGAGRSYGIVRHWPGHDDHFHIRFKR